jgi:cytochrome b
MRAPTDIDMIQLLSDEECGRWHTEVGEALESLIAERRHWGAGQLTAEYAGLVQLESALLRETRLRARRVAERSNRP